MSSDLATSLANARAAEVRIRELLAERLLRKLEAEEPVTLEDIEILECANRMVARFTGTDHAA